MGTINGFRHRILATKLRPPSTAVRHLPRPRLSIGPANEGPFRLALVSAPAGSGKTTVLTEWYRALQRPRASTAPAWLSLDDFDNEPRRFLAGLIAAVQQARPSFGREAHRVLAANPDALVEDVVTSLAHDFGRAGARVTVFLDDYHEIRDRAVHAVVDYLLAHVPAGCRFVIGTRADPPLSVERLRARGEVFEIRWDALRFRVDEARRYLTDVCRLRFSDGQVRALCDRTEGWIAGLQLAAMAFTADADGDRFVASITGEQRTIADYLLEGVFARQPAGVREFLMRTAILDRLTAPLCDALTGRRDGRQMLEALESGNLFLFALDDRRGWYRYHHLFAGFLRDRLRAAHPEAVADLHERASEWFEANDAPREAVRYAIAGSRLDRAARLLETAGRDLFRQGDFKELRRWIDAVPDRTVRRSPVLCALHAWALGYLGEFEAARRRVDCAEAATAAPARGARSAAASPAPGAGAIRAELQVIRAVLGIIQADEPDVSGLHPGIVSLFPREEAALRAYASITLGFVSRVGGYLPLALQHFQEALVVSDAANSSLVNLNARRNIGIVNYMMGRLNDAEAAFRGSLDFARERLWLRSIGAAFLRHGLALVLHEKNRLKEALEEQSDAIAVLEASDAYGFLGMVLLERARTQLALGRPGPAAPDLARARDVARRHDVRRVSFRADLLEAQAALRDGDVARAAVFLDAAREAFGGEDFRIRPVLSEKHECFAVEHLRLLLAREQFGEAVRLAGKAAQSAGATGRGRDLVEFLVLQASAWSGLGQADKALAKVAQAASLAAGEGIVRPFADAGAAVGALLRRLQDEGEVPAAGVLLASLGNGGGRGPSGAAAAAPAGKLHCRELQILELISRGLRNREIGERLFLSEETVKWYLKRLFSRLDVRTRTQAIAIARKLRLLS